MRRFCCASAHAAAPSLRRKRRSSGRGSRQRIPSLATPDAIETLVIKTKGDAVRDQRLAAMRTDVAVHSLKDLETFLPQALGLAAHLPREDPRDAFFSPHAPSSRPRQRASSSAPRRRGGARVLDARASGEVNATLLALAGVKRLGLADRITAARCLRDASGGSQGAIGVETRRNDAHSSDISPTSITRPLRGASPPSVR